MVKRFLRWPLKYQLIAILGALLPVYVLYAARILVGAARVTGVARSANRKAATLDPEAKLISLRLKHQKDDLFLATFKNVGSKRLVIVDPQYLIAKRCYDAWGNSLAEWIVPIDAKPMQPTPLRLVELNPGEVINVNIHQERRIDQCQPLPDCRFMYVGYGPFLGIPPPSRSGKVSLLDVTICSNVVCL